MRRSRGFTVVEMLVVLAIISILAGILIPALLAAKKRAKIQATKAELTQIKTACETYQTHFGDYPPSTLSGWEKVNDTNQGVEALVACLFSQKGSGPYLDIGTWERRFSNKDDDSASGNLTNWAFGDNQLREITDCWGSPYVYFHNRDFANAKSVSRYTFGADVVECLPQKSAETATYHCKNTFQLWSVGPDCTNNNASEDDVPNW
jgi:type II secretion system protein G